LGTPTPDRMLQVAQAMRLGWSNDEIFTSCKIDPWFLSKCAHRRDGEQDQTSGLPQRVRDADAEGDGFFRRSAAC